MKIAESPLTSNSSVALSKAMQACSHMNSGPPAVRLSTANAFNMRHYRRDIQGRLPNGQTDVLKSVRQRQRQSRSCIRLRAEAQEGGESVSNLSLVSTPLPPRTHTRTHRILLPDHTHCFTLDNYDRYVTRHLLLCQRSLDMHDIEHFPRNS